MSKLPVAERRGQIVEAAVVVALREGIDRMTTRRVAHEAGVAVGVLHYCFGTRDALLRDRGVDHVLICGIETPVCVYQTAIAALADELQVTVLSDAVGARRTDDGAGLHQALGQPRPRDQPRVRAGCRRPESR